MDRNPRLYVVFGYFNVIRNVLERPDFVFSKSVTNTFNNFILNSNLIDILMTGERFTQGLTKK